MRDRKGRVNERRAQGGERRTTEEGRERETQRKEGGGLSARKILDVRVGKRAMQVPNGRKR